jgi:hypothetical protein
MPNYVRNRVFFEGTPDEIRRMLEAIREESLGTGTIDFRKILPMPEDLNIESGSRTDRAVRNVKAYREALEEGGDLTELERWKKDNPGDWELGEKALANRERYGHETWYGWCTDNWGTKWPALHQEELGGDRNHLCFDTAWSFPRELLMKLSADWPDISFVCQWADEDVGRNCGEVLLRSGRAEELYLPEGEREAVEYAAEVWETTPREWGLVLNKEGTAYEYREEKEEER